MYGKVLTKHKGKSIYKYVVGIRFDDGTEREIDFLTQVETWAEDSNQRVETSEPCCAAYHTKVLTKAQAKRRPGLKEAMEKEVAKFESFGAFKRVKDNGKSGPGRDSDHQEYHQ